MSMATQIGSFGTFKVLWSRSPLWRFFLMSASLASMLFVLYPPNPLGGKDKSAASPDDNDTATYARQTVQSTPVPIPAPQPSNAVATATNPQPHAAASVPAAAIATPASVPVAAPAAKNTTATVTPKTADLSLVTAGATSASDNSGINSALMGRVYTGSINVDGYKIPLPSGNWVSLANTTIKSPTASGLGFFLGKIEHKRLVGVVKGVVMRSKDKPGAGFPELKGCTANDPGRNFVSIEEVVPFANQACWVIHSYFTPVWLKWADKSEKIEEIDRAAAGDLAAKGVTYPENFVDVHFSRTTTWGAMEVIYMFNPEEDGISSNAVLSQADMDWRANNINRYPQKVAYVNKLQKWGVTFWPQFKAGFATGERADDPMAKASASDVQSNTVAASAPIAPAPQIGSVTKAALSGKLQILAGYSSVNPDCTSGGLATVRVVEAPKHGKVSFVEEQQFPEFPKENPRNVCNSTKLPALSVKYQSEPDYVGNDMVKLDVIFPDGNYRTKIINILVK